MTKPKKVALRLLNGIAILACFVSTARADNPTETLTLPLPTSSQKKLSDQFGLTTFTDFGGGSITAPGSPYTPSNDGYDNYDAPIYFQNIVNAYYKVTPEFFIGPSIEYYYYPVFGGDYAWKDPFLNIMATKLFAYRGLKLQSDLRIYAPISDGSKAANNVFSVRVSPFLTYLFPKSRWSLGSYNYARLWFYGDGGQGDDWKIATSSFVNYQFHPKAAWQTRWEGDLRHPVGGTDNVADPTDVVTGIDWTINSWAEIYPAVGIYPGSFSWSSTYMYAELYLTIL